MLSQAAQVLVDDSGRCPVPALLRGSLLEQIQQIRTLNEQIKTLERQIAAWQRRVKECQRIAEIPGVGLLTATAAVATMGDAGAFRSGRGVCSLHRARAPPMGYRRTSEASADQ